MPRRDGTGPLGRGAMTGRGFGPCNAANDARNFAGRGANVGRGFGGGFGGGFGRGFGRGYCQGLGYGRAYAYNNFEEEQALSQKELLEMQKEALEKRLSLIDNELESL